MSGIFVCLGIEKGRKPTTKVDLLPVIFKYYSAYANGVMSVTELTRVCFRFYLNGQ